MKRLFNHISALIGLSVAGFGAVSSPVQAQTISNIATILWDAGQGRAGTQSNRVDIIVDRTPPNPDRPTLSTFQLNFGTGGQAIDVSNTVCRGVNGDQPVRMDGVFAGISIAPASVQPSNAIRAGEPLVVAINSLSDNRDPNRAETLDIVLGTASSDEERLTLAETAPDSGRFVGVIRTRATPPAAVSGDCVLSVQAGDRLNLSGSRVIDDTLIASAPVDILIDPFGIVFDSGDGKPVSGSRVTLIDVATGQPTDVFGDDGVSRFPNSVVTGSTVFDSSGARYAFPEGDYRFPFVRPGNYRLVVEPPSPYTAPSASSPSELSGLLRPDGIPFTIVDGSYSRTFTLNSPEPVRIDIPVDRPGGALIASKTASIQVAAPGDAVQYRVTVQNGDAARATGAITVTDQLPPELRLRKDTVRYNGAQTAYHITDDGRTLTVPVAPLRGSGSGVITYLVEVRPDAKPGMSMNKASASDNRGTTSAVVDATIRIARDSIGERMTIIGRITDGGCTIDPNAANGVQGVRVLLEDGSYAVTDIEGRYHFEGVLPGLHVVQIDPSSLPSGQVPADCTRNARSGGSAISRFIDGTGGALLRADFRTMTGENAARPEAEQAPRSAPPSDQAAAGSEMDWFADQTPEIRWLFPAPDHNPRTKAVRVAIKHLPGQTVALSANGKPVSTLNFEGARKNGLETVAVSVWRGVELPARDTELRAEIRNEDGSLAETLTRTVHFSNSPMRAELIREKSMLVADGVTRPVIAVRMLDRDGRPVHHGVVGDFAVPSPYQAAVEADAQAARQLSGLERARPVWRVEGDDGIAYIELEPTTASGGLTVTLPFRDEEVTRQQRLDLWLTPGKRPWTIVGFAAGTAGFNTLEGRLDNLSDSQTHWYTDARLALYAKGRVKGQWLMTLAYDSDKKQDESRFGGTIDPTAYYTVYADRTERRFDAASVRKLYVRLERPQFYALFGDYETAINEPVLTRYNRSFNGLKAEFRNENVAATAFAADTPFRHRREEIQGNGLTGPYALGARDILANSERVTIETRDRLRSDRIITSRTLSRHIDYDIDYLAGTLRFREPILSRSSALDPQFVIVDYEVDGVAQRVTNAGGRAAWTNDSKTLTMGATMLHDEDDQVNTNVGGVDLRYTPSASTEIRAEFAMSDANAKAGTTGVSEGSSRAWLVEAEHHGPKYDVLAYAREQQAGYGVGQTNVSETGTRKVGVDGRIRLTPDLSLTGSAWHEDYLDSDARREAARLLAEYRTKGLDTRAGVSLANDRLADGRTATSTIAQFGATKRFMDNRLELDAQTEVPIGNQGESIDFPARHKIGARFAVTNDLSLIGSYELADGKNIDARTARIGFDLKPWRGGRFVASANQQRFDEYGPRSYAAYGFAQSLPVGKRVTVDFTLDGNKTLGGVDPSRVLNDAQPVASGGFIGTDGTLSEDFTAVTAGANYRGERWSIAGRAEFRAGDTTDRYGLNVAALRQIGEGKAFGGSLSWFRAQQAGGPETETAAIALSWAHRPDDSRFAFLEKLELRSDLVRNAVIGQSGPIGGAPLTVQGNAKSQRVINSFSFNWSPSGKVDGDYLTRSEISLFWGSRYVFDRIDKDDLKGWSNVFGADLRFDLNDTIDLGVSGTLRQNPGGSSYSYSGGPSVGIAPFKNSYISVGYNVLGFHDKDFQDSRYTRSGPYVTLRLKFDQTSFAGMGLGRK